MFFSYFKNSTNHLILRDRIYCMSTDWVDYLYLMFRFLSRRHKRQDVISRLLLNFNKFVAFLLCFVRCTLVSVSHPFSSSFRTNNLCGKFVAEAHTKSTQRLHKHTGFFLLFLKECKITKKGKLKKKTGNKKNFISVSSGWYFCLFFSPLISAQKIRSRSNDTRRRTKMKKKMRKNKLIIMTTTLKNYYSRMFI